jgi:hypothetical protein
MDDDERNALLHRRGRCLYRLKRMRALNAPLLVLRIEQMILWGIGRRLKTGWDGSYRDMPGWQENYQKFVMIHMANPKFPS